VFVPQFSVKEDIVPGLVTQLHVTPTRLGTFPLECTELCGLGHSLMRSQAVVMEPAAFDSWLKKQEKSAAPPASTTTSTTTTTTTTSPTAAGLSVFNANGCSSCHTLSAANATGKIGPDLDNLVSYAKKANQPLEAFVRESIVDPNAYIQPGYQKNIMPATFGQSLTKSELDAVVGFLVQSAQKSGNK
jgi:cytochrome c oxidase subunit 2